MSSSTPESAQRKLLLVEGNDDLRLFGAMSEHLAINGIEISSYHGKDKLRNDLSDRVRNPDFQMPEKLGTPDRHEPDGQGPATLVLGARPHPCYTSQ